MAGYRYNGAERGGAKSDALAEPLNTRELYTPTPNTGLVRSYRLDEIGEEYIKLAPYLTPDEPEDSSRRLEIVADDALAMNGYLGTMRGDALFVMNALLAARHIPQKPTEIWRYGNGFRAHVRSSARSPQISTPFMRTIQALDAWARNSSDADMVDRPYGSGGNPTYMIMPDIAVRDART